MQEAPLLLAVYTPRRLQGSRRFAHATCAYQGNQPTGRVRQQHRQFGQFCRPAR